MLIVLFELETVGKHQLMEMQRSASNEETDRAKLNKKQMPFTNEK